MNSVNVPSPLHVTLNDPRREALALVALSRDRSNNDRARANFEKALHIFRDLGDIGSLVPNLVEFGYVEFSFGNYESAHQKFNEAIVSAKNRIFAFIDFLLYFPKGSLHG